MQIIKLLIFKHQLLTLLKKLYTINKMDNYKHKNMALYKIEKINSNI